MRVLQLLGVGEVGGTGTFVLDLVRGLNAEGVSATVVNTWTDSPFNSLARAAGVRIDALDGGRRRPGFSWLREVRRYLRSRQFDVVHAYGFRMSMGLRMLHRHLGKARHVMGVRGLDRNRTRWQSRLDRWTEGRVSMVVCNAQAVVDQRRKMIGTPDCRVYMIPNGIDTEYFSPRPEARNREALNLPFGFAFVNVATFRDEKDHGTLIDAFREVAEKMPNSALILVGEGTRRQQIERQIAELTLRDRIRLVGSAVDVRPYLSAADAFVLSSHSEGMPRALMEAMAMGLPIVTTSAGGVEEVVTDGHDALVVPTRSRHALAEAMVRIAQDRALRVELGASARRTMVAKFDHRVMIQRHIALYEHILRTPM